MSRGSGSQVLLQDKARVPMLVPPLHEYTSDVGRVEWAGWVGFKGDFADAGQVKPCALCIGEELAEEFMAVVHPQGHPK